MKKTIDQVLEEIKSPEYKESRQTRTTRKKNEELFKDKTEIDHYLTCKICGIKARDLTPHLLYGHKIDPEEYKTRFGIKILKCQEMVEMVSGENNPGYQHGGKLSPFSKNFLHGDISGQTIEKAIKSRTENGNNTTSLEYWLKKANGDEELAKSMLSNRQTTFSLEKCIEKYGENIGTELWNIRQVKWQNTLNSKSDEELKQINLSKVRKTNSITSGIENNFVCDILSNFNNIDEFKRQLVLHRNDFPNKFYMYDLAYKNKIIEFNGDYWHANPIKYSDESILYNGFTAKQIRENDYKKMELAKSYNYLIYVVWEYDYKTNKQKVIQECLNFLRE